MGTLPALAQDEGLEKKLAAIVAQLKAQENRLQAQETLLRIQQDAIAKQTGVIDTQRRELVARPTLQRAGLLVPFKTAQNSSGQIGQAAAPNGPVGEAPQQDEQPQVIQSLPEGLAVLTPAQRFTLTPSIEYTQTTNDRLVFRGVVIVPGINLGEVDASTDSRNIASAVVNLRYGITSRLEAEVRLPFTWSDDRATILNQGPNGSATQSVYLKDSGIGDVEFGARYQVNSGNDDWPVFVANARLKSNTGMGPFDIQRDAAGVAEQVALGSGFWAVSGGFSVLKISDPAVLFASVNYIYSIPKTINQNIGNVLVGRVEPGDSINTNLGFGFAINPEFSFSLGYEHSYIFPQWTMLGNTKQTSDSLQVGAMTLGLAYRLGPNMSLNTNFEFGVTQSAPDVRAVFSLPISF
jgi:hypothetical protein